MNQHQSDAFSAMKSVKSICKQYGIQYYLLAGSTLGAIRHGGFIPWDDDIDIGIKLHDLKKFEKAMANLPKPYKYVSQHNNLKYPRLSGKILYDRRNCIDIFPLVKISNHDTIAKLQWKMHKVMMHLYFRKIGYEIDVENRKIRLISKMISPMFSRNAIVKIDDFFIGLCEKKEVKNYCNITSKYSFEKELIKAEWIDAPITVFFEGEEMTTVGMVHDYLKKLYGNYMELPPLKDRVPAHEEVFCID